MKEVKEVIHVPTRELAEEVLRVAQENGYNTTPLDKDIKGNYYKENLCLELKPMSEISLFADIEYFEGHEYSIISAQEFLSRYNPKFRPIAMKCTQEQFEAVSGKLVGCRIDDINSFDRCIYLINNQGGDNLRIVNSWDSDKFNYGRQVFEEWNEKTFLEYCGIEVGIEDSHKDLIKGEWKTQDELTLELSALKMENAQLKKQLKEIQDQPKVGDVCLFWDGLNKYYSLEILSEIIKGKECIYRTHNNDEYANCIKATPENIQAKINELKNK